MSANVNKPLFLGLVAGVLALAAGCGSDYALFNVHGKFNVSENASDWQNVEYCHLSVTDSNGVPVIQNYTLPTVQVDSNTFTGCRGGQTERDIGHLSYSTSRTSGTLTFTIDGVDNSNTVVQSGSTNATVKVFHSASDEVPVEITISKK